MGNSDCRATVKRCVTGSIQEQTVDCWRGVTRTRARGRFFNPVDLVNQLEQEKAAGRSGRLAEKLLRHDLKPQHWVMDSEFTRFACTPE
jgi:hypothetical protein